MMDIFQEASRYQDGADRLLNFGIKFTFCVLLFVIVFLCLVSGCQQKAFAQEIDVDKLADAIYWAEGGPKAKKPYGILSVRCEGEKECRRVCVNTIKNNQKRFKEYGHKEYSDYLSFLASKYAPVGAGNDPKNLNKNWLKNVKHFYSRGGR